MQAQTPRRTTTHLSSHNEDGDGEGGRSSYPSDLQTTLEKLNVGSSEECDLTGQLSDSEASTSMENHTARRTTMRGSEAGQGDGVDRQHRRRDGGATVHFFTCCRAVKFTDMYRH